MKDRHKGIAYIIGAAFFFALMSYFARSAGEVPLMQKSFFRNCVALVTSFIILIRSEEKFHVKKGSWPYIGIRAFFGTCSIFSNFYAIDHLNLADASILNKLSPFAAIIFSWWVLREKPNKVDWCAVFLAFAGAVLVTKPTPELASLPAIIGFCGGCGAGLAYTYVRKLGQRGERSMIIVFFFSCFSTLVTIPFFLFDYHPITAEQLGFLLLTGVCATGGQICITTAYTKAPAKEISVFDYTQVIFAALLGFVFFGQIPDYLSAIGYVIIIIAAIWRWWYGLKQEERESVLARK